MSLKSLLKLKYYRKDEKDNLDKARSAVNDFRRIDDTAILHGSFNNGTYTFDSDIDLVSDCPVDKLKSIIQKDSRYTVISLLHTKIPRLIVFDQKLGFTVDIVNLTDLKYQLKDNIIRKIVEYDPMVVKCVYRLKKWSKHHAHILEPSKGYPNNYILQIILFYVMMKLKFIPYLTKDYDFEDNFTQIPYTFNQVINYFMNYLSNADNFEVVDLTSKVPRYSEFPWQVIEPSTNQVFQGFKYDVPFNVSVCAQNYFKYSKHSQKYNYLELNDGLCSSRPSTSSQEVSGYSEGVMYEDFYCKQEMQYKQYKTSKEDTSK